MVRVCKRRNPQMSCCSSVLVTDARMMLDSHSLSKRKLVWNILIWANDKI